MTGEPEGLSALIWVPLLIVGALLVLAAAVAVCWGIYWLFGGWFLLADLLIATPLAYRSQVRAMRRKGYPLPWEQRREPTNCGGIQ